MDLSLPHILLLLAIVVLLFGGRKIPEVMRGLGQGIREFKDGMKADEAGHASPPPSAPTTGQPGAEKK